MSMTIPYDQPIHTYRTEQIWKDGYQFTQVYEDEQPLSEEIGEGDVWRLEYAAFNRELDLWAMYDRAAIYREGTWIVLDRKRGEIHRTPRLSEAFLLVSWLADEPDTSDEQQVTTLTVVEQEGQQQ